MKNNNMDITYEKGIGELEDIISKIENNELSLEGSLDEFEKGITLYKKLSKILSKAEGKMKMILEDNGEFKETDFKKEV